MYKSCFVCERIGVDKPYIELINIKQVDKQMKRDNASNKKLLLYAEELEAMSRRKMEDYLYDSCDIGSCSYEGYHDVIDDMDYAILLALKKQQNVR